MAIDHPLNDFEIVFFFLAVLGSKYNSFVTSMTTRIEPMPIEDFYGHLLAHELHLAHSQNYVDLTIASANIASKVKFLKALKDITSSTHPQIVVNVMVTNITVGGGVAIIPPPPPLHPIQYVKLVTKLVMSLLIAIIVLMILISMNHLTLSKPLL